jgi:tryptophan-rich sensory protein
LIPIIIGGLSGFFTANNVGTWYTTIQKPSWNPPNWIFGPVWTTLYILMGIALYLVWKEDSSDFLKKLAIVFFTLQLVLNFFWSFIFFQQHEMGWALVEIIALWLAILVTIFSFANISKTAAWLLVPYIAWVSFATILNYTLWKIN